jgi:hypothetical protein
MRCLLGHGVRELREEVVSVAGRDGRLHVVHCPVRLRLKFLSQRVQDVRVRLWHNSPRGREGAGSRELHPPARLDRTCVERCYADDSYFEEELTHRCPNQRC